ncbi:urease accessory protein UreE [Propioniciclava flava]
MIVNAVLGNVSELTPDERAATHIERVVLPLAALTKRVQRVITDHGRELGIRLTERADLREGDILVRDERGLVVVAVEAADVLVIAPESIHQMGMVAHGLGNRHLQAQFFGPDEPIEGLAGHGGVMVIQYDHTAEHFLRQHGVRFLRTERAMEVPFRHAEHTH